MAIKRTRASVTEVTLDPIEPTSTTPLSQNDQFDLVLKRIQALENQNLEKDQTIKDLTKKVLAA
jgi:hypothetical protein